MTWPPRQKGEAGNRRPPHAATAPWHEDPRLRGRTYAIPFEDVWQAALHIAGGGARGWRVVHSDDEAGLITAEVTTLLLRRVHDATIRIVLDEDAQTRVDAFVGSRKGSYDLGANARMLRGFFRRLNSDVPARHAARLGGRLGSVAANAAPPRSR